MASQSQESVGKFSVIAFKWVWWVQINPSYAPGINFNVAKNEQVDWEGEAPFENEVKPPAPVAAATQMDDGTSGSNSS